MWISKKRWDEVMERIGDLERATGMTSLGSDGYITDWMKPALPINKVVAELAKKANIRFIKKCEKKFVDGNDETAATY